MVTRTTTGITSIQGSPGTGKTTLLAKIIGLLIAKGDLHGGNIVACAHSNQAAQVIVEKCHEVFPLFGLNAREHMILVETAGGVERRRLYHRTLPHSLETYGLDSQTTRLVNAYPARYARYLSLLGKHQLNELLSDEKDDFRRERDLVIQNVRDTKTLFVCTMATTNTHFFNTKDDMRARTFQCFALFCDEIS